MCIGRGFMVQNFLLYLADGNSKTPKCNNRTATSILVTRGKNKYEIKDSLYRI